MLALPSLCFYSHLEGELPIPDLPGCCGVLLAPGCLRDLVGAIPTG